MEPRQEILIQQPHQSWCLQCSQADRQPVWKLWIESGWCQVILP